MQINQRERKKRKGKISKIEGRDMKASAAHGRMLGVSL